MNSLHIMTNVLVEGLQNVGKFWDFGSWEIGFLLWLNSFNGTFVDKILLGITYLCDHGILWIASGIVMLFFKKTRRMGVYVVITFLLIGGINDFVMKPIFNRARPFYQKTVDVYSDAQILQNSVIATFHGKGVFLGFAKIPTNYSFFSGHAVASISCALMIAYHNRKIGIPAIVLAVLIAFTRLWFGVHWPTDVIFGLIFGVVATVGLYYLLRFLEPKVLISIGKHITKRESKAVEEESN